MSLFTIYVFTAGDDSQAAQGNPRRFRFSDNPNPTDWRKCMDFKAYRTPAPGTVPIYVSETGGVAGNPHRFRVAFDSGVPTGWTRDSMIFHAHTAPAPGTVQFYVMERGGGDPALGDPARCEITTNPTPTPGWYMKLSFFAFPAVDAVTIHCFTAGDDSRAHQGDPRRGNVCLDQSPAAHGWFKAMEFRAPRNPAPGTVMYYVSETGGVQGNPHRFRIHYDSGVATGWTRDTMTFHAYSQPTPGTVPFYVMETGGGDPAMGNPARCEIRREASPFPGWYVKSTFFAYP